MAVILITRAQDYIGLSSDTKPTVGVLAGSEFYETDSGATYIYDGSAWNIRVDLGPFRATKTVTFTGAAGLGAIGTVSYFTVTGQVLIVYIVGFCTTDLVGATGTLVLGVPGRSNLFIASTLGTDIDADEFWIDATPDAAGIALPAAMKEIVLTENIIITVAVADITAGVLRVDAYWMPLSSNGKVVAA